MGVLCRHILDAINLVVLLGYVDMDTITLFVIIFAIDAVLGVDESCSVADRIFVNEKGLAQYFTIHNVGINIHNIDIYQDNLLDLCNFSNRSASCFSECHKRCCDNATCIAFTYMQNRYCHQCVYSSVVGSYLALENIFVDVVIFQSLSKGKHELFIVLH